MKLYLSPGACSLADHIAMHEAGMTFDRVRVNLRDKTTEDGRDFRAISPKGYVPALEMDDGQVLTENLAILAWVAEQDPRQGVEGPLGRARLLEALAYITSEIHKSFAPFFTPGATDAAKEEAGKKISQRLGFLESRLQGDYLFGHQVTVADAYLYTMLTWAKMTGVPFGETLAAYFDRMGARPAVKLAREHEGLS